MTDAALPEVEDLIALAHPQPLFNLLPNAGAPVCMEDMIMSTGGGDPDVHEVLHHPEIYSSGPEAVQIGQIRPLSRGEAKAQNAVIVLNDRVQRSCATVVEIGSVLPQRPQAVPPPIERER